MKPDPDELKGLWQSQATPRHVKLDADLVLKEFRRNKQHFVSSVLFFESLLILGLIVMSVLFAVAGSLSLRGNLPWPVLLGFFSLAVICLAVAAYKGFDRFRLMRRRAVVSDPILACLEQQLMWVRHEIHLWNQQALWWYLLPLALGELVLVLSVRYAAGGLEALLTPSNLVDLLVNMAFVCAAQWFFRWWVRTYYAPREQELTSLIQSLQSS